MSAPPQPFWPAMGMASASGAAMPRLATALSVTRRASTGCPARSPAAVGRSRAKPRRPAPAPARTGAQLDDEEDDDGGDDEA